MLCTRTVLITETTHVDFETLDKRGRRVGVNIRREFVSFDPTDARCGWDREPGEYWSFKPWATRNGQCYGPVQSDYAFRTREEREAAIEKYLVGARKRAAKK